MAAPERPRRSAGRRAARTTRPTQVGSPLGDEAAHLAGADYEQRARGRDSRTVEAAVEQVAGVARERRLPARLARGG